MNRNFETSFFLGSNSPSGFYSLYDDLADPERDFLYIIKGGPGCGKSSFMRAVARRVHAAGHPVERIWCSGDPDSLDGIYFPTLRTAFMDGTSPHVAEPKFAGASDSYIDLSAFYDLEALRKAGGELRRLTRGYKAYYARAYKLISGAAAVSDACPGIASPEDLQVVSRRAKGIIAREIKPSREGEGRCVRRFLGAVTFKGLMCFYETVPQLAQRVYVLDNDLGLAPLVMEDVASAAVERGWFVIRCQCPMDPGTTEHVIIPGLDLAFVSQTSRLPYTGETYRHVRLDAIPGRDRMAGLRDEIRSSNRLSQAIVSEAIGALGKAKALHDRLEAVYNPHVDFDGVTALAGEYAARLIGA